MSEEDQSSLLSVEQPQQESAEPEAMPHLAQTEETPVEETAEEEQPTPAEEPADGSETTEENE